MIGQSHQRDTGILDYGPFHYRPSATVVGSSSTGRPTWYDTLSQTADVDIEIRVDDHGGRRVYRHRTLELFATPRFLVAIARLSGVLEAFAWYGDYRLDRPYDDLPASLLLHQRVSKAPVARTYNAVEITSRSLVKYD